jgi:hypothetical protein
MLARLELANRVISTICVILGEVEHEPMNFITFTNL